MVIRDLSLAKIHVNLFIFNLITEGKKELTLVQLLRQFVCTPHGSQFAKELGILINYYMRMYVDAVPGQRKNFAEQNRVNTIGFEKFNELIGQSQLAIELVQRFIDFPKTIFESETCTFNFTDKINQELQGSCMLAPVGFENGEKNNQ